MVFRFVHTSDWHIARTYRHRFNSEQAALLRDARARIPERIGALALEQDARVVLVAGDVFDSAEVADDILHKLAASLARFSMVTWHFLPGNHDAAQPNGIWARFQRIASEANVVIHHEAGTAKLADGVELLAAPLHARAISHDPTAWMDERKSTQGTIRIGLAHGSVQGFGSEGDASVMIAADRARRAALDYLALGDWHGCREAGHSAWYSGTPEPDRFTDNDPGNALVVEIAGANQPPKVTKHRSAAYDWRRAALEGNPLRALIALEEQLAANGADISRCLLELTCSGHISLDDEMTLHEHIERLRQVTFHAEVDTARLTVTLPEDGDAGLSNDPILSGVSARLSDRAAADRPDRAIAHRALLMLADFARRQGDAG